jgi:hypothetical protein
VLAMNPGQAALQPELSNAVVVARRDPNRRANGPGGTRRNATASPAFMG